MTSIDINELAREVLSVFQTDRSDYGYSDVDRASESLVKLIRAVVRTEVAAAFLEDPETALAKTQAAAELAADERRCREVNGAGLRCRNHAGHAESWNAAVRDHRFF